jgi:hypothetical protein
MAAAGALTELIVSASLWDEDKAMSLLHGANALGNASVALGYANATGRWLFLTRGIPVGATPWLVGVGAAVVIVTALGIYLYGKEKEASKFETETTTEYLKLLGLDEPIANELRNQDSEGRSPLPVLAQMAGKFGYDVSDPDDAQRFITYLNGLGKDGTAALVNQAHTVDPNDQGIYPDTDRDQYKEYFALPDDPSKYNKDPRVKSTITLGADGIYRDSVTHMFWDKSSHTWHLDGPSQDMYTPTSYDPETGVLAGPSGTLGYLDSHSLESLKTWALAMGLAPPVK